MIEGTINIPFGIRLDVDSHGAAYVDHPLISGYVYGSNGTAKAKLRTTLTEQLEEGLRSAKNCQGLAIGCADGSVFIVRYKLGTWSYFIAGAGRKFAGSSAGAQTFDATIADARKHAESNGGILWESSI